MMDLQCKAGSMTCRVWLGVVEQQPWYGDV